MATPRDVRLALHPNSDGQMGELITDHILTQETAFKLLKKALKAYGHGGKKLEATPIKDVLRLAAVHGLMTLEEVQRWFLYRDNRNSTAHDYGEHFVHETLLLIPPFLQDIATLAEVLHQKLGSDTKATDV